MDSNFALQRRPRWLFAILVVSGLAVSVAYAGENDGWRLRVDFAVVEPGENTVRIDGDGLSVDSDLGAGAGLGLRGEYRFSRRLGTEIGWFAGASVHMALEASQRAEYPSVRANGFSPLTLGLDVHLTPGLAVDLYVGPQIAWVSYEDVEVGVWPGGVGTRIGVDRDLGLGAILGADVPLGTRRRWMFQASLRRIDTTMEGRGPAGRLRADFDPTIVSVGFGYRFRGAGRGRASAATAHPIGHSGGSVLTRGLTSE